MRNAFIAVRYRYPVGSLERDHPIPPLPELQKGFLHQVLGLLPVPCYEEERPEQITVLSLEEGIERLRHGCRAGLSLVRNGPPDTSQLLSLDRRGEKVSRGSVSHLLSAPSAWMLRKAEAFSRRSTGPSAPKEP
jgi:hypothetical protein